MDRIVDSFAAYFQFPRSATNTYDTIERIVSIPILGTAFIAIRRKFERINKNVGLEQITRSQKAFERSFVPLDIFPETDTRLMEKDYLFKNPNSDRY